MLISSRVGFHELFFFSAFFAVYLFVFALFSSRRMFMHT